MTDSFLISCNVYNDDQFQFIHLITSHSNLAVFLFQLNGIVSSAYGMFSVAVRSEHLQVVPYDDYEKSGESN